MFTGAALRRLLNLTGLQLGWFACVLGAAWGWPWVGPVFSALWLSSHLASLDRDSRKQELYLLIGAGIFGYLADSALVLSGTVAFPPEARLGGPSPLWMVALWMNFASALRTSAYWLVGRYALGALLGLMAPLTYWSGARLGAIVLVNDLQALLVIALEWVIGMPVLLFLERLTARRFSSNRPAKTLE